MQLMDKDKAKMLLDIAKLSEKARTDIVQFVERYEKGECKEKFYCTTNSTDFINLGAIVQIKEKV